MRLDVYLATYWPENSRATWQKLCKTGHVLVNGKVETSPKAEIGEDDEVKIVETEKVDFTGQTLPVIYEDDDVIVINKPSGVLTHAKGELNDEFTVGEFMKPRTTDGAGTNRPGIVHRLDRETSGVIIAAKNNESKRWLQKQFATRKVKKTYMALVEGRPKEHSANIDLPILRNPKKPQTFKVDPNGKPAQTFYDTVENFKSYTLLRLKPFTGRTHQLRVHLNYIGCPIVGDKLYGHEPPKALGRLFLHAAELELTLPNRERKVFKAELPPELQNFLKNLK
ncbi:MAG TPA: RluA family pseudouridine synthase [Candidatus Saccharimonadales bacterium]|nr:RluA family pseudouridine synthase [Candidatus Saccharimonadales bacterium]